MCNAPNVGGVSSWSNQRGIGIGLRASSFHLAGGVQIEEDRLIQFAEDIVAFWISSYDARSCQCATPLLVHTHLDDIIQCKPTGGCSMN